MKRSVSWMQGYNAYYNQREFSNLSGSDKDEWLLGYSYAMDEDFESTMAYSK